MDSAMGPAVWTADVSSLRFVRKVWGISGRRTGPVSVRHIPGLRAVGYIDGGIELAFGRRSYWQRCVFVVRDGDEAIDYWPMEAVAPTALTRAA